MITEYAQALKKAPSWIYKTAAQTWIDREFPRHVFLETTAACNLSCDYCPREKAKDHMQWELFRSVVDECKPFGPRSFSLHLFGEPLLYPYWRDAIAYIKASNKRNTVLLTTNGTMFEKGTNLRDLIESKVDKVIWSWRPEAAFSLSTRLRLRKWGRFTVRLIREAHPPEAFQEWSSWPQVEVRNLHNYGSNIDTTKWQENTVAAKTSSLLSNPVQSRWPCYHLWLAPAVAWNGDILMCCSDPHRKEVLGHYPQDSLTKVWMGPRLQAIRESHLRGQYGGICTNCDVWKSYPDIFFKWQKK